MKKNLILIFASTLFLISCQKNTTPEPTQTPPNPTPPTVVDDSTLLSLYVEIDTTAPLHLDTLSKAIYTYDNLKRIIKYDWVYYTNGIVTSPPELRWTNTYSYNGTDTLPFKELNITNEQGTISNQTIFHTYASGKLIFDSSSTGTINKYNYLPTKTVDTLLNYYTTAPLLRRFGYRVTYRQTTNGNILTEKDSVFLANNSTNPITYNFFTVDNRTCVYDNSLNPLTKFNLLSPFPFDGSFEKLSDFESQSVNNISDFTEVKRSATGTSNNLDIRNQISYVYRTNSYPKISRIKDLLTPSNSRKGFYYYTK